MSQTGLDNVLPFATITADTAAGLLEAFGGTPQLDASHNPLKDPAGGFLNNLTSASSAGTLPFLDFHVPFGGGTTLGDLINFAEGFEQKVINFGPSGLIDKRVVNNNAELFTNFISAGPGEPAGPGPPGRRGQLQLGDAGPHVPRPVRLRAR